MRGGYVQGSQGKKAVRRERKQTSATRSHELACTASTSQLSMWSTPIREITTYSTCLGYFGTFVGGKALHAHEKKTAKRLVAENAKANASTKRIPSVHIIGTLHQIFQSHHAQRDSGPRPLTTTQTTQQTFAHVMTIPTASTRRLFANREAEKQLGARNTQRRFSLIRLLQHRTSNLGGLLFSAGMLGVFGKLEQEEPQNSAKHFARVCRGRIPDVR